jgi:Glycosyl hydrolases family 32 N-terminal domain
MILKRIASIDCSRCYSASRCHPDWHAAHRKGHARQPWRRLLIVAEDRPSAQMAAQSQRASLGPDPATDPDQPVYHVAPRQGWANDGNGFIYHKGRYHMCAIAYDLDAAA